jgi:hypothetical protein
VTGRVVYVRRISSEEAREGYIMILKSRLAFFPPAKSDFDLIGSNLQRRVRVESYGCTCRGPDFPHEHYFISWKGLKAGNLVEIHEDPRERKKYVLRVSR